LNKNFDVCKEAQKEHTYRLDGLISGGGADIRGRWGGLISGIISLLANRWAYI